MIINKETIIQLAKQGKKPNNFGKARSDSAKEKTANTIASRQT